MPKTVSTTEAKNQLSALIDWAAEHRDEVIIENHGRPRAVITSSAGYEETQAYRDRLRREEVLATMQQLHVEISECNQGLTDAEIEDIANQFSWNLVEGFVTKGNIRFEQ